jgi:hypothetical protein
LQTPLNKAPSSQGGKEGTKREDPSPTQKSRTHSESLREEVMFKIPHQLQEAYQKKKDEKLLKAISLEKKSSLPTMTHLKIEVT